jgi:hypothetical protein
VRLEDSFPRGQRLAFTARVESEALGCAVLSGWRRVDLR